MPRGFITLTRRQPNAVEPHGYRVAVDQFARYGKNTPDGSYVILKTIDSGENEMLHVTETPEQIDALIEQAQSASDLKVWGSPQPSEFATAMGEAVQAFGGAR